MKLLTTVLAITFTILAMKSGLDLIQSAFNSGDSCSVTCCEDMESSCEGKACNPFQACNTCVLICPSSDITSLSFEAMPVDHGYGEMPSFISEYDSEFWQPPKIG